MNENEEFKSGALRVIMIPRSTLPSPTTRSTLPRRWRLSPAPTYYTCFRRRTSRWSPHRRGKCRPSCRQGGLVRGLGAWWRHSTRGRTRGRRRGRSWPARRRGGRGRTRCSSRRTCRRRRRGGACCARCRDRLRGRRSSLRRASP